MSGLLSLLLKAHSGEPDKRVQELRAKLPYLTVIGKSDSMAPWTNPGETHRVVKKEFKDLKQGDCVVFLPAGYKTPVGHSFVRFVTSGRGETAAGNKRYANYMGDNGISVTEDNYIGVMERLPQPKKEEPK